MKTYLEYKDEKSHKFWQIAVTDNAFTVTYGKVGTNGQSKTKTFDTAEKATLEAEKIITQKLKKGYKPLATILVEKWDDELQKIIEERARNSSESIEKFREWLTNAFTLHLEDKINKGNLDKLNRQKVQEILKILVFFSSYKEAPIPIAKPKEKPKATKSKNPKSNAIDYFSELVKFNEQYGGETYAQSFCIVEDEEDYFETWLDEVSEEKAKEYSDALEIFASADGTGAHYAFWFTDGNTDKNKAPIIYYGSEGDIIVVAENIKDLIKMLSFGTECMDGSFCHYIDDEASYYKGFLDFMPNHLIFREWMKNTLNIEPVNLDGLINDDEGYSEEVEKLQKKAEKKIKKAFDKWQYQFYPSDED